MKYENGDFHISYDSFSVSLSLFSLCVKNLTDMMLLPLNSRSLTELGSSHVARTSMPLDGLLSNNCEINPDFCYWNVVVLQYCDGSSFLGTCSMFVYNIYSLQNCDGL